MTTMTFLAAIIPSALGIIATIVAWKLNPRRKLYDEIDAIYLKREKLYVERDEALKSNNSDQLTAITVALNELRERKKELLQRLGQNNSG